MVIGVFLSTLLCFSAQADSLLIDSLLQKSADMTYHSMSERLMFFAESFVGFPYKGGTLDCGDEEELIVRTDSFDCTTYVETVLALYLTSLNDNSEYADYIKSLMNIRYRKGIISGYASRLHYFSDWVADNAEKGILFEVTQNEKHDVRTFTLNYMSTNYGLYRKLKNNDSLVSEIRNVEYMWKDYKMPYIPKKFLNLPESEITINDGDIIALTTDISGLDVVHLGFAVWIDNRLHLLHASSIYGKVIMDPLPLYDYLKDRKKHTGVRVIRVK